MTTESTTCECKRILQEHYGERFSGTLLFGSAARHDREEESDLDLLVLLSTPFDYFDELRTITALLYPVQLQTDVLISAKPAAVEEFDNGTVQLYRNAKREGVLI